MKSEHNRSIDQLIRRLAAADMSRITGLCPWLRFRGMRVLGVLVMAAFYCATGLRGQPPNNDAAPSYDSFSLIWRRNIFDPNRRAMSYRRPSGPSRTVDAFALVGTLSYSKGKFAFFNGTSPDYKKVLEPGASIAGYTIKDITAKNVLLAANGKEVEMNVGSQMRNEGRNNWKLSAGSDLPTSSDSNTDTSAALTPPAGASPAMSDVLKRLMEQRQQEIK